MVISFTWPTDEDYGYKHIACDVETYHQQWCDFMELDFCAISELCTLWSLWLLQLVTVTAANTKFQIWQWLPPDGPVRSISYCYIDAAQRRAKNDINVTQRRANMGDWCPAAATAVLKKVCGASWEWRYLLVRAVSSSLACRLVCKLELARNEERSRYQRLPVSSLTFSWGFALYMPR